MLLASRVCIPLESTRVVCILRVVEEESTHDQRHNFCLILYYESYNISGF